MNNNNYVPEKNTAVGRPDWFSLTLLKRVELSSEEIEILLTNEISTRNRKNVVSYFRAFLLDC